MSKSLTDLVSVLYFENGQTLNDVLPTTAVPVEASKQRDSLATGNWALALQVEDAHFEDTDSKYFSSRRRFLVRRHKKVMPQQSTLFFFIKGLWHPSWFESWRQNSTGLRRGLCFGRQHQQSDRGWPARCRSTKSEIIRHRGNDWRGLHWIWILFGMENRDLQG